MTAITHPRDRVVADVSRDRLARSRRDAAAVVAKSVGHAGRRERRSGMTAAYPTPSCAAPPARAGQPPRRGHDVAEEHQEIVQRRRMLLVGQRGVAVGQHDDAVVEHHRVARGRLAAHVGHRASNQKRLDAARLELRVDIRRARDEGAVFDLLHAEIARQGLKLRIDLEALVVLVELRQPLVNAVRASACACDGCPSARARRPQWSGSKPRCRRRRAAPSPCG